MTLRRLHGLSALLIATYAGVHIANHLAGLDGVESHIAFMRTARLVYRFPVLEVVLLMAVALQIHSGLTFVVRGWRRRQGFVPWLQAGSGAYLVFFLLNHVGAVLFGRAVLHLDTNFYYAAAGFHVPPFQFFFAPYYFLSVLALFSHLGCAVCRQLRAKSRAARVLAVAVPSGVGFVVSLLIVLSLAGALYPVQVPARYKAIYGGHLQNAAQGCEHDDRPGAGALQPTALSPLSQDGGRGLSRRDYRMTESRIGRPIRCRRS